MNKVKGFQDTIDWYNNNAKEYAIASAKYPTIQNLEQFISVLPKNGKVLDAGCGAGRATNFLQKHGFQAVGLDLSEGLIQVAKEQYPQCAFAVGDLRFLPFEDSIFDGICSEGSLLHMETIEDVEKVVQEFERVLKPQGIVYILVKAQMGNNKTAFVSDKISAQGRFFQYFTKREVEDLLKARFKVESIKQYNETEVDPKGRKDTDWIIALGRKE
ncbi:MAG TPA: class I SAM-dependent methyltransferase [Candidatus Eisenbacteria bacterium]|nr:class I SAM-dependent methyltransferase [Candidatus Eisenbacteria bacterium]